MMATEIIEIDAAWAEKWTKTGVPFLSAPTVYIVPFGTIEFHLSLLVLSTVNWLTLLYYL